jgi:DNA mismatch repair protein MutS2
LDSHSIEVLGFPRVREMLAGLCQTEMGRERALALACSPDSASVKAELDRLDEVCARGDEPPLADIKDVRPLLGQLRAAGTLTGPELLLVRVALTGIRRNREFFQNQRRELPGVWPLVSGLVSQPQLENRIDDAVDEAGEVRDSATPELADIRRRLRRLRNGLVEKLERLAAANPQWFNGPPTIRGDRFVLPLLLEQRNRVQGVIHGSSGSGQTLFVGTNCRNCGTPRPRRWRASSGSFRARSRRRSRIWPGRWRRPRDWTW